MSKRHAVPSGLLPAPSSIVERISHPAPSSSAVVCRDRYLCLTIRRSREDPMEHHEVLIIGGGNGIKPSGGALRKEVAVLAHNYCCRPVVLPALRRPHRHAHHNRSAQADARRDRQGRPAGAIGALPRSCPSPTCDVAFRPLRPAGDVLQAPSARQGVIGSAGLCVNSSQSR